jgi:chromosome segregation ATPase
VSKKTKEVSLEERIQDARGEQATTVAKISELERELAEIPRNIGAVDWSDETAAISEVAELERRRDGLPHYIRHLREESIEQEISLYNLQTEAAEERREPLSTRVEELQAEFDRARAVLNEAKGELHELLYGELSDLRRNISDAEKRLAAIDNEIPAERGPIVRSVWQRNFTPNQDPGLGGDSPSTAWGTANVSDQPLSAGADARRPTPVIPRKALEAARKKGG